MKIEPFELERYFAEHEFNAPYMLCGSDCESFSIAELLDLEEGAYESFTELRLGYTESKGNPNLRALIASLYEGLSGTDILVHSGAEEAIFNFMNVTLNPGDHIIVHAPYYQSLGAVARGIGARVPDWPADPANNWALDLDFVRRSMTEKTKVVVVNFPHNPTGCLADRKFLIELSRLSDNSGFIVLSDEVYRGLEYDRLDRLPSFADLNERGVAISVMSKAYGLAGLRIGWIATPNRALLESLASFKDYTTICNSAPSEFLASLALRHSRTVIDWNLGIIARNLAYLDDFFSRHTDTLAWRRPDAGSVAFPAYLGTSAAAFCDELRREAGVLLLPGSAYGRRYENFVRIGCGRKNLPEALERFERYFGSRPAGSRMP